VTVKALPSYVFSIDAVQNQAGAYVFLSLFNPAGSGRVILVGGIFISSTLLTSSSITSSMRGWRISTASAGTLQADSAVTKVRGHFPDPTAEVRTSDPTVTLGSAFFNSPAPIADKQAPVHEIENPPGLPPFTCAPGEGIALRTASGIGIGATWNLSVAWAEGP
jgi:hypothetical protein